MLLSSLGYNLILLFVKGVRSSGGRFRRIATIVAVTPHSGSTLTPNHGSSTSHYEDRSRSSHFLSLSHYLALRATTFFFFFFFSGRFQFSWRSLNLYYLVWKY